MKIMLKLHFPPENVKILVIMSMHNVTKMLYVNHYSSSLSFLSHGVISLPDMASCDKRFKFLSDSLYGTYNSKDFDKTN